MVVVGETACVPVSGTPPMLLMLTEVAFWTAQASVELWPAPMDAGFAVKLEITGRPLPGPPPTVTVAVAVIDWAPRVAVKV